MKLGLLPPYRGAAVADPEWVRSFCAMAEAEGVESVWTVEHVVVPAAYESTYPYAESGRMPLQASDPIPDPLDWIAFGAGATSRLVFGTAILILPEHNPVHLAKRLATIDVLSGGRLLLGIGVGWLREEFDAIGVPFERRGARTDEYIEALRTLWRDDPATMAGTFVGFHAVTSRPSPVRGRVPIVVGGHSPAAARRAGRLGDGFYPLGVATDELPALLDVMRSAAIAAGRDPDAVEITAASPRDRDDAARLRDLGVARLVMSARPDTDIDGIRQSVARYRERVVDGAD